MGETISRLFTPKGTDVSGGGAMPMPVSRTDESIEQEKRNRASARVKAIGFGGNRQTLTAVGAPSSGGTRRPTLVGDVGS